ncbi:MAG: hypothetical protein ACOYCD_09185 [Kiritimatiellia bacterium]
MTPQQQKQQWQVKRQGVGPTIGITPPASKQDQRQDVRQNTDQRRHQNVNAAAFTQAVGQPTG